MTIFEFGIILGMPMHYEHKLHGTEAVAQTEKSGREASAFLGTPNH
jgi:hypothetical protein